jgi:hypothetical protein
MGFYRTVISRAVVIDQSSIHQIPAAARQQGHADISQYHLNFGWFLRNLGNRLACLYLFEVGKRWPFW